MSLLETANRADDDNSGDEESTHDDAGGPNNSMAVDGSPARISWRSTALLAVAVAALRYLYSSRRYVFSLMPDEVATVGMSRFLSGGHWNQLNGNIYRPGLPTILAPIFAVVDDPHWAYRCGLMVNAAIAGATMFWLVPIIRRFTPFGNRSILLVAGLIALAPASLSASSYLWAEPLVTLCFLATLYSLLRFSDVPRLRSGVAAVLWPALGYTAHGRLLPLIFLSAAAVLVLAVRNRRWLAAATSSVAAATFFGISFAYQRWVVDNVWDGTTSTNTATGVAERLREPLQVLDAALGQLWYQLSASALLAALGLVALVRRSVTREATRARSDALVLLWLTLPLVGVSMVFMSDRARADHVIYGRYNDAVIWPVLAVGAGWLFLERSGESRKVRLLTILGTVAITAELGLLLRQLHHLQFRVAGVEPMIAGITPAMGGSTVRVLLVTGVAIASFGLLYLAAVLRERTPIVAVSLVVGLVAIAGVRGWELSETGSNAWASAEGVKVIDSLGVDASKPIGVSYMPDDYGPAEPVFIQMALAMSYQWFLPNHRFAFDNGPKDTIGPYVFAVSNDALLTRDGGRIVWLSPTRNYALWLEPEILPDGSPNPAYESP